MYLLLINVQRAAATERYHLSIEEMLHNERQAELRQEEDKQRASEESTHRVCFPLFFMFMENI